MGKEYDVLTDLPLYIPGSHFVFIDFSTRMASISKPKPGFLGTVMLDKLPSFSTTKNTRIFIVFSSSNSGATKRLPTIFRNSLIPPGKAGFFSTDAVFIISGMTSVIAVGTAVMPVVFPSVFSLVLVLVLFVLPTSSGFVESTSDAFVALTIVGFIKSFDFIGFCVSLFTVGKSFFICSLKSMSSFTF